MSIHPSSIYRSQSLPSNLSYFVVGDTILATFYCNKLHETFQNEATPPTIYLVTSGASQMTDPYVESLSYIYDNNAVMNKTLQPQRVHLVLENNEPVNANLSAGNVLFDQYYNFISGEGVNGDAVSAYYLPIVGPWLTSDTRSRAQTFVKNYTIQKELTSNELIVANNLASMLGLSKSTSIVATKPTILMLNNIFVYHLHGKWERQLFRDMYVELTNDHSINTVSHTNTFTLQEDVTNTCLYTVKYTTMRDPNTIVTVDNSCVLFMDNLYEYVKIMGISEVPHKKVQVPVFYRYIFAIPKVNNTTGVNLSNLSLTDYPLNLGDGVSLRLTFSTTDVADPGERQNNLTPTWNVTMYCTDIDLSQSGNRSTFANTDEGKTLLIVEATSLTNRRTFEWNSISQSVDVGLNRNVVELGRYGAFLLIAANCFQAITGFPPELPLTNSICTTEGICTQSLPLEVSSSRESPQTIVLRLLTSLYGGSTFTTAHNIDNGGCCG